MNDHDTNNEAPADRIARLEESGDHILAMLRERGVTEEEILQHFKEWRKKRRDSSGSGGSNE